MLTGPAFVFPGQGSQYPGMARELGACGPAARRLVATAERVTGLDLTALMGKADAATLADPRIAQLVVFVSSTVMLTELRERGIEAGVVAGHSLGEYTALVASGCLDWHTGLALVELRGRAMADAAQRRPGAMGAVVGLELPDVERLCRDAVDRHGTVVVANINSARQVVVSGTADAVQAVLDGATGLGALRAKRIPVGGAYHSPLMDEAQQQLAAVLGRTPVGPPRVPFVSSITADLVTDVKEYQRQLQAQITRPVLWHAVVRRLANLGVSEFVEVGPGKILKGLGRETARGARHLGAFDAMRMVVRPTAPVGPELVGALSPDAS